ncbi:Protein CBG27224 [Caenorhabditis briggsae]|uniref:Protein CBG27224 n=1 Tax=Caenorhabditis briggsae TaxID=6238 RepID=B6IFU7_CAEBR|nr:Protein CBG27224 [Caenorhabditis briggsae]CAR98763.1 Protein CBG27224 [Caenorhabditis briggsae]
MLRAHTAQSNTHLGIFAVLLDCFCVFIAPAAVISLDVLFKSNEFFAKVLPFLGYPTILYTLLAVVTIGTSFLTRNGLLFQIRFVHNEQVPPANPIHPNRA